MNRREFLLSSGTAAIATMAGVTPGRAWELKQSPENVFDNLSRALWASTNKQGQKAAYVIAAPWCPVTRSFYDMVRQQSFDCDFRFVWQNDRSTHQAEIMFSTYFQEGDNQLVPYENDVPQADGADQFKLDVMSGINESTISAVGPHIRPFLRGGGNGSPSRFGWGYPTVVYKSQGSVKAVTGLPNDLGNIVASIDAGIDREAPNPALLDLVRQPPPFWKTDGGDRFVQVEKAFLYAAPTTDAPIVEEMERGHGYATFAETEFAGDKWLGFKAFGDTWPILWGKLDQFKPPA